MTVAVDVALLVLATARLTRLVTTDTIVEWEVHNRVYGLLGWTEDSPARRALWEWYEALVSCPHCVGFWIGAATLGLLAVAGGPGAAAGWWRWGAGAFALSYVVGHVSQRLDGEDPT